VDGGLRLIDKLRRICGDEHVVTDHHALRTYESDGLLQYAAMPRVAVLPGTGDEVAAVVRACHEAGVAWVARGSGSGLSGGALPIEDGVLVVLSRLRRILEVDLDNQRVVLGDDVLVATDAPQLLDQLPTTIHERTLVLCR
jgi:glycolate oxidase